MHACMHITHILRGKPVREPIVITREIANKSLKSYPTVLEKVTKHNIVFYI